MFKNANEVVNASDEQILALVNESWNANLLDILDEEYYNILKEAEAIEREAEKIAFAIRDRHVQIVDKLIEAAEDEDGEFDEDGEHEKSGEFMNAIAAELGQCYDGADAFWIPSTCW